MKKSIIALSLALSFNTLAAETQPDPSDMTATNSFVSGIYSNEGEVTVMGGIGGSYSEGNNFLGLVEHKTGTRTGDDGHLPQDTRLRYFQVFDVEDGVMPQVGFSVDYMKSWKMTDNNENSTGTDLVALGAIAKVKTGFDAFTIFPNIAYVQGKAKAGTENADFDMKGYQVNLFGSVDVSDRGDYVVLQPQFMQLDITASDDRTGSIDAKIFKMKTGYGAPIDDGGKWWVEISHTYTRTDADINVFEDTCLKDNDHLFEMALSYYF